MAELAIYKIPLFPVDLGVSSPRKNMAAFAEQTEPSPFTGMYGLPTFWSCWVVSPIYPLFNTVGSISRAPLMLVGDFIITTIMAMIRSAKPRGNVCSTPQQTIQTFLVYGHPPLIGEYVNSFAAFSAFKYMVRTVGWSLDGFLIYGRHLNKSNTGYYTSLDTCSGHTHKSYNYHYNAQVPKTTAGSAGYYIAGVNQCWRGNISSISLFGNSVNFQYYSLLNSCTLGIG